MNSIIDLMFRNMLSWPAIPPGGSYPVVDDSTITGRPNGESVREAVIDLLADGWPLAEIRFDTSVRVADPVSGEAGGWRVRLTFIFGLDNEHKFIRTGVIADSYEHALEALTGLSVESDGDDLVLKVADDGNE